VEISNTCRRFSIFSVHLKSGLSRSRTVTKLHINWAVIVFPPQTNFSPWMNLRHGQNPGSFLLNLVHELQASVKLNCSVSDEVQLLLSSICGISYSREKFCCHWSFHRSLPEKLAGWQFSGAERPQKETAREITTSKVLMSEVVISSSLRLHSLQRSMSCERYMDWHNAAPELKDWSLYSMSLWSNGKSHDCDCASFASLAHSTLLFGRGVKISLTGG